MTTRRQQQRRPGEAGVTLIELMVSLLITSIAVAAALGLAFQMMNSYRTHQRMVAVERAGRVSLEIMADAIRGTSAGVLTGQIADEVGCSDNGAFEVINNTDAPDELQAIYASGGVLTSLRDTFSGSSDLTVTDGTGFQAGDYVIITNLDEGHVLQLDPNTAPTQNADDWTLPISTLSCGTAFPAGGYQPGDLVIRAKIAHFFIQDINGVPTLMMDPDSDGSEAAEPLAEGVEDMQIAVGVDTDDDGDVEEADPPSTTDEWFYNVSGDPPPPSIATTIPRALRLTLVSRSFGETSQQATSVRPAVEDREAATEPDVFRRRVLSTIVEIRNLEGSP